MTYVACEYVQPLGWCVEFVNDSVGMTCMTGLTQEQAERVAARRIADEVGSCPSCGSGVTWRVGRALGGSPGTCACSSCNSYFQREVVA